MLGFVSILLGVVNFAFGDVYEPHWSMQVVSGAATIVLIVLGLKKIKESNGNLLSLGEALKTGLGIALVSGVIYIIYFFVFVNYIEPDYFANLGKVQEAAMLEAYPNWSDEQMEASLEMAQKMSGFGMISAIVMIMSLLFGFVISLIAGLIMKRTEEDNE